MPALPTPEPPDRNLAPVDHVRKSVVANYLTHRNLLVLYDNVRKSNDTRAPSKTPGSVRIGLATDTLWEKHIKIKCLNMVGRNHLAHFD